MKSSGMSLRLVGIAEISQMFGVSRQRAQQLVDQKDFPKPVAILAAGRIWRRREVVRWARKRGRAVILPDEED